MSLSNDPVLLQTRIAQLEGALTRMLVASGGSGVGAGSGSGAGDDGMTLPGTPGFMLSGDVPFSPASFRLRQALELELENKSLKRALGVSVV